MSFLFSVEYLLHIIIISISRTHYLGESGLVYKGYIDTPLGSEIVAVKTGKGIKNSTCLNSLE